MQSGSTAVFRFKREQKLSKNQAKKKARGVLPRAYIKKLAATYSPILLCIVPSAKKGLTSEFEMGSGVSLFP